jgi:hypothetical protein
LRMRMVAGGGEGRHTGGGRRGRARAVWVRVRDEKRRRTVMTGGTNASV